MSEDDSEEERDYIAEMDARIAEATKGSDWVAAVVAQKLCGQLRESDPDLLDGWLHAMAVPMLRRVIGQRAHHERLSAKRGARARAFSAAAGNFESAPDGEERESAAASLLGMFSELHVVDEGQTRKRAADMSGPEHLFVADTYKTSANTALMLSAFHRAVAKKVGDRRTADVLTEEQYEAMYLSLTRKAA